MVTASTADPNPRAGLRTPPPGSPTGAFVVVEMTILVIVVALAMVAVIVANADEAGRGGVGAHRHAVQTHDANVESRTHERDVRRAGGDS